MYLVVIAWVYVTLMMALAEAFSTQGTVLGAIFTFLLYGVLPMSVVVYILGTPSRRRAKRAEALSAALEPDASSHASGLPQDTSVPAVGKEV